jgi:hypothetical protein
MNAAAEPLVRIAARKPVEVCSDLALDPAARALLTPDIAPSPFLTALIQAELLTDAIAYLAHALPARDAVSWACACVRAVLPEDAPAPARAALAAAEAWVAEPNTANGRQAESAADAAVADERGARFAALAAFWCGDNIAPQDAGVVPPPAGLAATGIVTAVTMAAYSGDPLTLADRQRQFLSRGILIAREPLA